MSSSDVRGDIVGGTGEQKRSRDIPEKGTVVAEYMFATLHEHDVFSVLHFDQNWDRDLPRLLELPRRSFVLALDGMTDIRRGTNLSFPISRTWFRAADRVSTPTTLRRTRAPL